MTDDYKLDIRRLSTCKNAHLTSFIKYPFTQHTTLVQGQSKKRQILKRTTKIKLEQSTGVSLLLHLNHQKARTELLLIVTK